MHYGKKSFGAFGQGFFKGKNSKLLEDFAGTLVYTCPHSDSRAMLMPR